MRFSAAYVLALSAYVAATPASEVPAPLEVRQSLPSINYRSFVNGACSGSGTVFNSRVNACSVLPGASTRLETRPGICTVRIWQNPGCSGSSRTMSYNVCADTRNYNSIRVTCT
ncbi:hypothetical protein QBC34DRAFT_418565 [Podospora aff. communis PSN243]|uniref:Cyanovirin-N domain-containing protein n=1 Tax=Podospora aff. communis PSN243 TaxID=3040156 RepID=A0AAV9FYR0_9PEZI|nr:hypothetical protein QBC34DRAFT_418565 [Podospora aff. communis PSN243]